MVFDHYARYYNLLYKDKNYSEEAAHIHQLIKTYAKRPMSSLLDIGCGTGTHAAFMNDLGYKMTGIDQSTEMIRHAIAKNISDASFVVADATNFSLGKKFDVVTALFHVMSYQNANITVNKTISNANSHLTDDGLFIFDFWYGPAVLTERPSVKIKRLEDETLRITRIAEPELLINENVVNVNFELHIYDKEAGQSSVVKESHPMRYFFKPEIEAFLEAAGMKSLYFREWISGNEPSAHTWGVCCVASKK